MKINYLVILAAAVIPMIIGFLWYGPMLFQKTWMKEANVTEEKMRTGNIPLIFGLSFLCSFIVAFFLQFLVIHQIGVFQTLINEPGFKDGAGEAFNVYNDFMAKYGTNFRSFGHGAIHGVMAGLLFITPIISIKALFERKTFKYIAINAGYWIVTLTIMGGIVCQWA